MNNCPQCGKNMDLVGRQHRCIVPKIPDMEPGNRTDGSTYRYRDPESRRVYMKEYMRKRREQN